MESSLASGWQHMLIFGVGSFAMFLWLAWFITLGIRGHF